MRSPLVFACQTYSSMETTTLLPTKSRRPVSILRAPGLMRMPVRRERMAILEAALDRRVSHFEVVRAYGLGAAEAELGRLLHQNRAGVTIATTFALETSSAAGRLA
jgi:aryl-alcohol dehydrogenase-like predicted oxidoreductase